VAQVLQAYCRALRNAQYPQAYAQWLTGTQMSENDFAYTQQGKPKLTACETGTIAITNATAQAMLTFSYADGSSVTDQINLVMEQGVWKLKSQSSM
jgi:hypothetical protein